MNIVPQTAPEWDGRPKFPKTTERFLAFHRSNPQVFDAFVKTMHEIRDEGIRDYNFKMIMELARWNATISSKRLAEAPPKEVEVPTEDGPRVVRLPNEFSPYYARMLNAMPEFEGIFELHKSVADRYFSEWINEVRS